jgi:hypothetical protein
VTGLVAPMKLDTPARLYFEDVHGGMGKGFRPRRWRRADLDASQRLWSSGCGVGANMGFRRSVFRQLGTFDTALDLGTAARGGGDVEMFHRVITSAGTLLYEPSALVWHEHRADFPALARQLADNGCGFAAYLWTCARNRKVGTPALLRFAVVSWAWGWLIKRLIWPGEHRRSLAIAEIRGALQGIVSYARARKQSADALSGVTPDVAAASVEHQRAAS